MTARREARHPKAAAVVDGLTVPPELLDDTAPMWQTRTDYLAYMDTHGWTPDVRDRFDGSAISAPPTARRWAACEGWAVDQNITVGPDAADWHRMRAMGLVE